MTYVEKTATAFYKKVCKQIDALYDSNKCRTREDLAQLINSEIIELMKLQQFTSDGMREACFEGLQKDGIEFPGIFWARYVGAKLTVPYYYSIHSEVPPEKPVESRPSVARVTIKAGSHKILLGKAAIVVVGAGTFAAGVAQTPIAMGLVLLGFVVTAAGVVLVKSDWEGTKQVRQVQPAAVPIAPAQNSEDNIVRDILQEQRKRCKEDAKTWCDGVLGMVLEGLEKNRAEENDQI